VLLRDDGSPFTTGSAKYLDLLPGAQRRDAKVYVRVAVGAPIFTTIAMLDSGATYSVLDADLAEELGGFDEATLPIDMATRRGILRGQLIRRTTWLLAENGDALEVDTTFWISREWRYGHFLGYAGLLQRIRFGLDPQTNQFHFGPIEG
jgi:hypothetical protein